MKKILVIEDEPEMRRNLLTILRMEKFEGLGAEHGRTGLELARKEKPDLILCDVMMPELDGHGVLEALRGDPATAAIPPWQSRHSRPDATIGPRAHCVTAPGWHA